MTQLHIVTVGISLLTNFAKAAHLPLDKARRCHKQLAAFLDADPCEAMHETYRVPITLPVCAVPF